MKRILIIILLFSFFFTYAQQPDTTKVKPKHKFKLIDSTLFTKHNPRMAVYLSTLLPGAGQIYNKQWLHVPVIYAALIYTAYNYRVNAIEYWKVRNDIISAMNNINPSLTFNQTNDINQLQSIKESYRSRRDLSALLFIASWTLNVLDAYVGAEFYNFDISDDLSLYFKPGYFNFANNQAMALSIGVRF